MRKRFFQISTVSMGIIITRHSNQLKVILTLQIWSWNDNVIHYVEYYWLFGLIQSKLLKKASLNTSFCWRKFVKWTNRKPSVNLLTTLCHKSASLYMKFFMFVNLVDHIVIHICTLPSSFGRAIPFCSVLLSFDVNFVVYLMTAVDFLISPGKWINVTNCL